MFRPTPHSRHPTAAQRPCASKSRHFSQDRSGLICFAAAFQSVRALMCLPSANQHNAPKTAGACARPTFRHHPQFTREARNHKNRAGVFQAPIPPRSREHLPLPCTAASAAPGINSHRGSASHHRLHAHAARPLLASAGISLAETCLCTRPRPASGDRLRPGRERHRVGRGVATTTTMTERITVPHGSPGSACPTVSAAVGEAPAATSLSGGGAAHPGRATTRQ
jgi:hypothetical protein